MSEKLSYAGAGAAIVLGLYLSSLYSYILFHSLIEIATIAVAFSLFILVWNTRAYSESSCLRLLGIGYAISALIDLVHTLAYKGMNVFPGYDANLPTQLWIAARYLQTVTLCAAPFFVGRRLNDRAAVAAYAGATAALVALVFSGRFPDCYIEGTGLTAFKVGSEYLISAFLLASLYPFFRKRKCFDDKVFVLAALSIACTAASEIAFTAYVSVYGAANLLGHFFKLAAFYLIYRAILVTGLRRPFDLIFRDLKLAEQGLRKAQDTLEDKVRERTAELRASEERYRSLIRKVPTAIVLHDGQGRLLDSNPFAQELLGLSAEQLQGKALIDPSWQFLREDGSALPVAEYPVALALSTRKPLREQIIGVRRPGRQDIAWVLVNAEPERDEAGEIARVIVSFVDITARKRAEEELQERGRRSQSLLRLSRNLETSRTYAEVLEAAQDEVRSTIGYRSLWAYLFSEDRKYAQALVAGGPASDAIMSEHEIATLSIAGDRMLEEIAAATEIVVVGDARSDARVNKEIVARLGNRTIVNVPIMLFDRHLGSIGTGTFGEEGVRVPTKSEQEYLMALASHMAVTLDRVHLYERRRQAEDALRQSEGRLRAIFETLHELIWLKDPDGVFLACNPMFERLLNKREAEIVGKTDYDFVPRELADFFRANDRRAMESGRPMSNEEWLTFADDGHRALFETVKNPMYDADGRLIGVLGIARDITERKQAELRQRASEQAFRAVVENTPDVIVRYDRECRRIFVNPRFERVNRISAQEVLGKKPVELSTELAPRAAEFTQKLMAAMDSGTITKIDLSWTLDGKPIWWFVRVVPEFDAEGKVVSALTIWSDITERKRAEAQLRLAASVFEHAHEGVTIADAAGNIIAVNRRFTEVTGYSAAEVFGRNPRILKSGRHDAAFYRAMWASIEAEGFWTGEIWNKRKDGSVYPEWLSISSVRDDGGKVANYVAVFADVSERVAAETALRESEQHLRFALGAARMLAWERDLRLDTMTWGEHPEWALGPEPAGGYPDIVEMVHPQDREAFLAAARDAVEHGTPYSVEFRLMRTDGVVLWVRLQGMPFSRDRTRPPDRIIGVSQDITERRRIEDELRRLNEDLERRVAERTQAMEIANRELEAFSYSVSHDLRAPLRAIIGFSQILCQESAARLDEDAQDLLKRISAGAAKMAQLIDDLLKLSRLSRQEMRVGTVDLSALARELVEELQAGEAGRKTTWLIAPQVVARGDAGLLRVMLYNLLENARKYSSKRAAARVEFGLTSKDGRPVYFVRDNGAGFDMAHAGKLFGAFQRLHTTAEFPGSGIGLATVARVIQRHGGKIWAESRPGEGATFYFTL